MSIQFTAPILEINQRYIIHLPEAVSNTLPSRGMLMAEGTLSEEPLLAVLEPDGYGSHWFAIEHPQNDKDGIEVGSSVTIELTPLDDWVSPSVPDDMHTALVAEELMDLWQRLTVKAQWEWLRWVRSTKSSDTRAKRIRTMQSMLSEGKKRPCCFNSSQCTVVDVSKSGKLLLP